MLMAEYPLRYQRHGTFLRDTVNNSGNVNFPAGSPAIAYMPPVRVTMIQPQVHSYHQVHSYSRHEPTYRRRLTQDPDADFTRMLIPHSPPIQQRPSVTTGGFLPPPPPPQSVKYTMKTNNEERVLRKEYTVKYMQRLPVIPINNDTYYVTPARVIRSERSHGLVETWPISTRSKPNPYLEEENICKDRTQLPPISIQNEPVRDRVSQRASPVLETHTDLKTSPVSPDPYPLPRRSRSDDSSSDAEYVTSDGPPAKKRDRGRPDADSVMRLQREGESSSSAIKCNFCSRVFPREKSLQAHVRTHKGVKPFNCDFPACQKAFVQSGQLKTHQRLHTGEKPFSCQVLGCETKFAHSGRHCPKHPQHKLIRRDDDNLCDEIKMRSEKADDHEIREWLKRFLEGKKERRASGRKLSRSDFGDVSPNPRQDEERPATPNIVEPTVTEAALALVELHHGTGR